MGVWAGTRVAAAVWAMAWAMQCVHVAVPVRAQGRCAYRLLNVDDDDDEPGGFIQKRRPKRWRPLPQLAEYWAMFNLGAPPGAGGLREATRALKVKRRRPNRTSEPRRPKKKNIVVRPNVPPQQSYLLYVKGAGWINPIELPQHDQTEFADYRNSDDPLSVQYQRSDRVSDTGSVEATDCRVRLQWSDQCTRTEGSRTDGRKGEYPFPAFDDTDDRDPNVPLQSGHTAHEKGVMCVDRDGGGWVVLHSWPINGYPYATVKQSGYTGEFLKRPALDNGQNFLCLTLDRYSMVKWLQQLRRARVKFDWPACQHNVPRTHVDAGDWTECPDVNDALQNLFRKPVRASDVPRVRLPWRSRRTAARRFDIATVDGGLHFISKLPLPEDDLNDNLLTFIPPEIDAQAAVPDYAAVVTAHNDAQPTPATHIPGAHEFALTSAVWLTSTWTGHSKFKKNLPTPLPKDRARRTPAPMGYVVNPIAHWVGRAGSIDSHSAPGFGTSTSDCPPVAFPPPSVPSSSSSSSSSSSPPLVAGIHFSLLQSHQWALRINNCDSGYIVLPKVPKRKPKKAPPKPPKPQYLSFERPGVVNADHSKWLIRCHAGAHHLPFVKPAKGKGSAKAATVPTPLGNPWWPTVPGAPPYFDFCDWYCATGNNDDVSQLQRGGLAICLNDPELATGLVRFAHSAVWAAPTYPVPYDKEKVKPDTLPFGGAGSKSSHGACADLMELELRVACEHLLNAQQLPANGGRLLSANVAAALTRGFSANGAAAFTRGESGPLSPVQPKTTAAWPKRKTPTTAAAAARAAAEDDEDDGDAGNGSDSAPETASDSDPDAVTEDDSSSDDDDDDTGRGSSGGEHKDTYDDTNGDTDGHGGGDGSGSDGKVEVKRGSRKRSQRPAATAPKAATTSTAVPSTAATPAQASRKRDRSDSGGGSVLSAVSSRSAPSSSSSSSSSRRSPVTTSSSTQSTSSSDAKRLRSPSPDKGKNVANPMDATLDGDSDSDSDSKGSGGKSTSSSSSSASANTGSSALAGRGLGGRIAATPKARRILASSPCMDSNVRLRTAPGAVVAPAPAPGPTRTASTTIGGSRPLPVLTSLAPLRALSGSASPPDASAFASLAFDPLVFGTLSSMPTVASASTSSGVANGSSGSGESKRDGTDSKRSGTPDSDADSSQLTAVLAGSAAGLQSRTMSSSSAGSTGSGSRGRRRAQPRRVGSLPNASGATAYGSEVSDDEDDDSLAERRNRLAEQRNRAAVPVPLRGSSATRSRMGDNGEMDDEEDDNDNGGGGHEDEEPLDDDETVVEVDQTDDV